MRDPSYSSPKTPARPFRRTVARGVIEQHSRRCDRSASRGRRCTCSPSFIARAKRDGQTHARTFVTLTEAVAWVESTRGAFLRGEVLPPAPVAPATPFRDVAVSFVQRALKGEALTRSRRPFAVQTVNGYEVALRLRALPYLEPRSGQLLGELPVDAIDGRMVQGLVDQVATREGAARARHTASAVMSVLRYAYERGLRDELPARVQQPPPPPRRTHILSEPERRRVRAAAFADDRRARRSLLGPLVTLLEDSGMRIVEALGLVWGPGGLELHADGATARVVRETTKTDAGVREIPLDSATARVLRRHLLASGRPADGAYVFADERGRRLNRSGRVRSGFERLEKVTGLELSPHVFRHTHATELAALGIPPAAAAQRLGHADGGVTFMRTYAHPGAAEAASTAAKLREHRQARRAS